MIKNRRKIQKSSSTSRLTNEEYSKVNQYIICQIKRKIQPFYLRSFNKFRSQQMSPSLSTRNSYENSLNNNIIRISETLTQRNFLTINAKKRNKIKSQMQNIVDENEIRNLKYDYIEPSEKVKHLKKKVQQYITQRKSEISQKYNNLNHQIYQTQKKVNKMIAPSKYNYKICSKSRPFDFSKINTFITQNYESMLNSPCKLFRQRLKQQQDQQCENQITSKKSSTKIRGSKSKKSIKFAGSLKKKNSLNINSEYMHDEVDLQFQQGLVEQIYTVRRIKFRRKMFESKSKKKLLESKKHLEIQ